MVTEPREMDLSFSDKELPVFRGEYLPIVFENFLQVLRAFDRYALREQQPVLTMNYVTEIHGEQNRPVYEQVSHALAEASKRGKRTQFLHRLRETAVKAYETALEEDRWTSALVGSSPLFPNLSDRRLESLKGVSSGLRDLYKVMADVVRVERMKEEALPQADIPSDQHPRIPENWLNDAHNPDF